MVINWLEAHDIEFVTRNIFASIISHTELKEILRVSAEGFDSIISKNSKIFKNLKIDLNDLTIKEASDFIIKNPSILRRPIMIDTDRGNLVVGFNKDSIEVLLPKHNFNLSDIPKRSEKDDYEISEMMQEEIDYYKVKAGLQNVNETKTIEKISSFDEQEIKKKKLRIKK